MARLAEPGAIARFLAVVGPSGSGKSSVVRAGLLPALRHGAVPGSQRWSIVDIIPGTHPLEELEAALLRVAVNPPPSLLEQLQADERGLLRAVNRVLPSDAGVDLVLLIDQFEEVFTLIHDEPARAHLLASLVAALTCPRPRLRVIVTLRADFYDRPLRYLPLGELMRSRTEVVLPLAPDELERSIVGPAERAGLQFEPGLVAAIMHDVDGQPGALPLLQYALTELVDRQDDHRLTLAAYAASGGVVGAVGRRAEELYRALDEQGQAIVRQLCLRLVTLSDSAEDTRRRAHISDLAARASDAQVLQAVLTAFGRYRLLTFDRDPFSGEATVEIAHEALIRAWERLHGWLQESRVDRQAQRRLAMAAAEWDGAGRDPSFLASGARLAQFELLATETDLALNLRESTYIAASIAERDRLVDEERARQAILAANQRQSEALRLAAEATVLLQAGGKAELIALLAIRSIRTRYTPQGDAALAGAAMLDFPLRMFVQPGGVQGVAWSSDGCMLLTTDEGTLRIWDAATGSLLQSIMAQPGPAGRIAVSPLGHYVLTGGTDRIARIWDLRSGAEHARLAPLGDPGQGMAFSPDGRIAVTADADAAAHLWDVQTGVEFRRFAGGSRPVYCVAVAPDGQYVATGGSDGAMRIWELATGVEVRCCIGHTALVWSVVFSQDGKLILSAGYDKTARLWDVATGVERHRMIGHSEFIKGADIAPDGSTVLTGSDDGSAWLWDVTTGAEVHRFLGHTSFVFGVAFAPAVSASSPLPEMGQLDSGKRGRRRPPGSCAAIPMASCA